MNSLSFVDNWKTYLIAGAAITVGLYKYNQGDPDGEGLIWFGLSLIGLGHKIDKLRQGR